VLCSFSFFLFPSNLLGSDSANIAVRSGCGRRKHRSKTIKTEHLRAVIVKVTQGDKVVISQAFGESMNGVPATTAMHFRNVAVAFAHLGTLLMKFVDEKKIKLDDTIERWMPNLP
jgi:CubicO group peptidase (beta-lactamase class C family)